VIKEALVCAFALQIVFGFDTVQRNFEKGSRNFLILYKKLLRDVRKRTVAVRRRTAFLMINRKAIGLQQLVKLVLLMFITVRQLICINQSLRSVTSSLKPMFKNYLKIAWRNLLNQKLYSLINIIGLAVGLAVCLMIMLYVVHESNYDRFHKNAGRIFTPNAQFKMGGNTMNMAYTSYATGELIKQSQPTVESFMRTLAYFKPVVVYNPITNDQKFSEEKLMFADAGFFNFFSFKLISGQASDVLAKPYSVVISKDMAQKYFGTKNPVGKTLTIKTDSTYQYQVTGVAENAPSNSSIDFNFVASSASLLAMKEASLYSGQPQIGPGSFSTYLLLKHAADSAILRRNLNLMAKKSNDYPDEQFFLTALPDTHLNNYRDNSNIKYLKIFPIVAVLILLLALVNYMSLSTARATLRAKEVGVRKISGANRKMIAAQFYIESAVFTCISFTLGYALCFAFKPWFLNVLQLKIDNSFLYSPLVLSLSFVLLILTILISGSYPSLVLSSFKPITTLKGKMSKQAGGVTLRKFFTTLQFAISVGLIICGITIDRQLYFFRHADTGIDIDNVVMIPVGNSFGKSYPAFKKDVEALAGIRSVATAQHPMFQGYDAYSIEGKTPSESTMLPALAVGDNFINTLGLKWKIPPSLPAQLTGSNKVVINELAVVKLHLPANPIGSLLKSGPQQIEVVGVLKNFNFTSMEFAKQPLGLFIVPDTSRLWSKAGCNLFAKIKPHTNLPTVLASIQNIYKKYDNDTPFSYTFIDEAFNAQYKAEDRLASIFSIFTAITIVLAALGLFGLAAFTIEQRRKEIGIRKVLGASLAAITSLLSKDFLILVILAITVASPIAWWAMYNWLQGFAYRIEISWWIFALAALIATIIALATVSFQAIKAALANPVKSLRSE